MSERTPAHDMILTLGLEANCGVIDPSVSTPPTGPLYEVCDAEGEILCWAPSEKMGRLIADLVNEAIVEEERTRA